jgi:uncharacterized protein (DUF1919 family)
MVFCQIAKNTSVFSCPQYPTNTLRDLLIYFNYFPSLAQCANMGAYEQSEAVW